MENNDNFSIMNFLSKIEDPRINRTKRHNLVDILFIAICASMAGADSWIDIEHFGETCTEWFKTVLELPNGIPSHDTFARVFSKIDPKQLNQCLIDWIQQVHVITKGQIVAIDGKTIRGSFDTATGKKALHLVSAWARDGNVALGQVKSDEKSNEIKAIPELISLLQLKGAIVTLDAIGCQKDITKSILNKKANYVLAVKKNQPTLHQEIDDLFRLAKDDKNLIFQSLDDINKEHGRIENRSYQTIKCLKFAPAAMAWLGANAVGRAVCTRDINGKISTETRYYITSLDGDVKDFSRAVRGHWSIENCLHWVLDVTFNEDKCRSRKDYAAENLAVIRKIVMNMLKKDNSKGSMRLKRKRAGWDPSYLHKVLTGN